VSNAFHIVHCSKLLIYIRKHPKSNQLLTTFDQKAGSQGTRCHATTRKNGSRGHSLASPPPRPPARVRPRTAGEWRNEYTTRKSILWVPSVVNASLREHKYMSVCFLAGHLVLVSYLFDMSFQLFYIELSCPFTRYSSDADAIHGSKQVCNTFFMHT